LRVSETFTDSSFFNFVLPVKGTKEDGKNILSLFEGTSEGTSKLPLLHREIKEARVRHHVLQILGSDRSKRVPGSVAAAIRSSFFLTAGSEPSARSLLASSRFDLAAASVTVGKAPNANIFPSGEAITKTPQLRAAGLHQEVQSIAVRKLQRLVFRDSFGDCELRQQHAGTSPIAMQRYVQGNVF
jgi:hypothetical protein